MLNDRKIVNTATFGDQENGYSLVATADDGTAWLAHYLPAEQKFSNWIQVKALPKREDPIK